MITIMLADDNKFALRHFARLVEWENFGFQLIDTAIDGIEAWNKFCRLLPDVVITDVQMPGIDGRELARRIKEKRNDTIVIFLSSYDEFDYARSAIDLSVQEYILKQELDKETLEKKLGEIRRILLERTEKKKKMGWGHLITCFHTPAEDLDLIFYQEVFKDPFGFFVLEQDHIPDKLTQMSGYETEEVNYREILPKLQTEFSKIRYLIHLETYRWVCLCTPKTDIEQLGIAMAQYLEKETEKKFSLILFPGEMTVVECRKMYEKAKFLFEQRYFERSGEVMYADMYEETKRDGEFTIYDFQTALKKREEEEALRALDHIFRPILYSYDFNLFQQAMGMVLSELEKVQKGLYEKFELYDESVSYLMSVRTIVRWLKAKTAELLEIGGKEQHFTPNAMERAVRFIYQEYGNSLLSVEEIAEKAGLSVNRLNDLFKKEQGETVGRFLTRIRMKKAKELLDRGEKIPDIVDQVGYASASYFARVFRKMYHVSPQEYRRKGSGNE